MKKLVYICISLLSLYSFSFAEEPPRLEMNTVHQIDRWDYSADGRFLVTAGSSTEIRVYESESMRLLRKLPTEQMNNGIPLPDGSGVFFFSGKELQTISFADRKKTAVPVKAENASWLKALDISRDGKKILAVDSDRVFVISYPEGGILSRIEKREHGITMAMFSPDGTRIALTTRDNSGKLYLYSVQDSILKELGGLFSGHSASIQYLCFSEDSRFLVSCGNDRKAVVWDLLSMSQKSVFKFEGDDFPESAYLGKPGSPVIMVSFRGVVSRGDISTGKIISQNQIVVPKNQPVNFTSIFGASMFSPDGSRFCIKTGPNTGPPIQIRTDDLSFVSAPTAEPLQFRSCSISADGSSLMIESGRDIYTISTSTGGYQKHDFYSIAVTNRKMSSDQDFCAYVTNLGYIELYSFKKRTSVYSKRPAVKPDAVAVSDRGEYIAAVYLTDEGKKIHAMRISTSGNNISETSLTVKGSPLWSSTSFSLSADGRFALIPSSVDNLFAVDFQTGRISQGKVSYSTLTLENAGGDAGLFKDPAFLKAFPYTVFSPNSSSSHIFDLSSGKMVKLGGSGVICHGLSPDMKKLLVGFGNWTIQVYDLPSLKLAGTVILGAKGCGAVHPDGRYYGSTPEVLSAFHWVAGDEAVALQQFGRQFYSPGVLNEIFTGRQAEGSARKERPQVSVQRQLIGKVFAIEGDTVIVASSISGSLVRGKKLLVISDEGGTIALTITMPMHTSAKCSIADSSKKKLVRRRMPVFRE